MRRTFQCDGFRAAGGRPFGCAHGLGAKGYADIPDAVPVLDATIDVLAAVRARGDATNEWEIAAAERPVVLAWIEVAEACIGVLDVALLAQTAVLLQEQLAQE